MIWKEWNNLTIKDFFYKGPLLNEEVFLRSSYDGAAYNNKVPIIKKSTTNKENVALPSLLETNNPLSCTPSSDMKKSRRARRSAKRQ